MSLIPDASNDTVQKTVVGTRDLPKDIRESLKPSLTKDQIQQLKNALQYSDAKFYIRSTSALNRAILAGEPKFIINLNNWAKIAFIDGNGIRITQDMLIRWLEGKLDPLNSFILDYSEIRVEDSSILIKDNNG